MMFLQYFIWGSWGVAIFTFIMNLPTNDGLDFPGGYVAWIGAALPIGGMITPLFVGLFADRFFATERVLAVLHVVGGILIGLAAWFCDQNLPRVQEAFDTAAKQTKVGDGNLLQALAKEEDLKKRAAEASASSKADAQAELESFQKEELQPALKDVRSTPEVRSAVDRAYWTLLACLLGYAICFMPTLTLTNALSFRNLSDPDRYFGGVRVLGTIGWIVAGVFVEFVLRPASSQPLYAAAVSSIVMGAFCLFLPHTPPSKESKSLGDLLGLPALAMLKDYSFLVFFVCSFFISIVLSFYYQLANPFLNSIKAPHPTALQTIGQVSEIFFMLLIPVGLKWLGTKNMLSISMLAWVIRYLTFASMSVALVIAIGLPLHGICYDFFFVVSYLYVDRRAPKHLRATAQSMIGFVTLGLGPALGNVLAGQTVKYFELGAGVDWAKVWLVPLFGSAAATIVFYLLFREEKAVEPAAPSAI
jgi:nucleoside transporter